MVRITTYVFLGSVILLSFLHLASNVGAQSLVSSSTISVAAIVGSLPTIDPGTHGGGGNATQSGVRFSGFAYPYAIITVQKDLNDVSTVLADEKGLFTIVLPENNQQFFSLFATDTRGNKSTLINFLTTQYSGYLTDVTGIRFAPTITTDKIVVKQNDYITISGSALPNVQMIITFSGAQDTTFTLAADERGYYSITAPLQLAVGEYTVKIEYKENPTTSRVLRIVVGTSNVYQIEATSNIPGDCNVDQKITLADFSVLAYWFGKKNPPRCVDVNNDGQITLVDFSIVAYYWNG